MSASIQVCVEEEWPTIRRRPTIVLKMSPVKALVVASLLRELDPDLFDEIRSLTYPQTTTEGGAP